jgi:hypothetical protein
MENMEINKTLHARLVSEFGEEVTKRLEHHLRRCYGAICGYSSTDASEVCHHGELTPLIEKSLELVENFCIENDIEISMDSLYELESNGDYDALDVHVPKFKGENI